MRDVESRTMVQQGVSALDLMERAGRACAERILQLEQGGALGTVEGYAVLIGMGNNGGDGAVLARYLLEAGKAVRITIVQHRSLATAEQRSLLERLKGMGAVINVANASIALGDLSEHEVVVDSMLGCGLARPVTGWFANLIDQVNASGCRIIAIDVPTGMTEPGEQARGSCIQADHTLTFEVPRSAFFFPDPGTCVGSWQALSIGLDPEALLAQERLGEWVQRRDVRRLLKERPRFAHKGTFGHALLVAGSEGFNGAAVLCSRGCAKSGVGLLTVHGPEDTVRALNVVLPDAMTSVSPERTAVLDLSRFSSVAIGPGLGLDLEKEGILERIVTSWQGPLVVDADALTMLSKHPQLHIPQNSILTPHPKEMDRLLGHACSNAQERTMRTQEFAERNECYVVLKGAYTAICTPEGRLFFNSTGNVGMAKGGSGDVLTGSLAGLLAQGYSAFDACLIGVHLHGLAGDLAAADMGADAMRASDLVTYMPAAWQLLRGA
ncbi:MAG: NAD(P)H-hydrate dehydratase [Flavobacteriales bacterium]|nr:NAD(P)H-hydrate dehydratase [Flavobacteriales bacterium]